FSPLRIWSLAPATSAALLVKVEVAEAAGIPMKPRAYDWALESPTMGSAIISPGIGLSPAVGVMLCRAARFVLGPSVTGWFDVTVVLAMASATARRPTVEPELLVPASTVV